MVTRLSTGDWFTAKVSACGLFTAAYKHIKDADQRTELRSQVCVLSGIRGMPMWASACRHLRLGTFHPPGWTFHGSLEKEQKGL